MPVAAPAQTPSPAPSVAPSATASAKAPRARASNDASPRLHRAIVDCDYATFYNWPARDVAPSPSSYPSARMGDGFDVLGDAHVSDDGLVLYETTIDVVHPWGDGVHYWIAARCVNAA
ncbi:MAG: hypothetical protein IAI50_07985 [Candidatus Eremiobacteraeota bacterium]|nr:hypothetical protein [Candidatus Eremiobacteraeota bacterium]